MQYYLSSILEFYLFKCDEWVTFLKFGNIPLLPISFIIRGQNRWQSHQRVHVTFDYMNSFRFKVFPKAFATVDRFLLTTHPVTTSIFKIEMMCLTRLKVSWIAVTSH